ncbi:MAG: protein-disulfide reductase DsbD domain-containing protein [Pseudorhodobacter sp.]
MDMRLIALILAALMLAAPAFTQTKAFVGEMRPGWVMKNGNRMAALHLKLAPGWKTYWRAPGDNGIPPSFDWTGSRNLGRVRYHWPRPHVFETSAGRAIGYSKELVLPLEITPAKPGQPVHLEGQVDLGVCQEICVPANIRFKVTLPDAGQQDDQIARALRQRPSTAQEAGLRSISCSLSSAPRGLRLVAALDLPSTGGAETVVVEPGQPGLWVSEAQVRRDGRKLWAEVDIEAPRGSMVALERKRILVTVLGRNRAVEIAGCPAP